MITQFDKNTCKLLAKDVEEALGAVAAKHGLTVRSAGGVFSGTQYTAKVQFNLAASNPFVEDAERAEFARHCRFYNLVPSDYGTELTVTPFGKVKLVGFAVNRSKFPIKVRTENGDVRLYSDSLVRRLVKPAAQTAG